MSRVFVLEDRKILKDQITVETKLNDYGPFSKTDVFISNRYETPFECRLDNLEIPRESLVIVQEEVKGDLEKYREYDYDFFMGGVAQYDMDVIEKYMYMLIEVTKHMVNAGYFKEENNKKIPDWIITFHEPILKMFITYCEIETSCEDIDITDEFLDNPQFRQMITETLMRITSNFLVNNKNMEGKDWKNEETWMDL